MTITKAVQFLNVDLILTGEFDRKTLLRAMGDDVFVLHDDAVIDGERSMVLEVPQPDLDVAATLAAQVACANRLPPAAAKAWASASRRVFDIGIQAGKTPHETHWAIPADMVAALARIGAEITLTVYGADEGRTTARPRRKTSLDRRRSGGPRKAQPRSRAK